MLTGIEPVLASFQPDWMVVQGDTNSTLAGALAAAKLNIPVAHLEAGCRSFNRSMPEEINRVVVDHISTLLLAPDRTASSNLRWEGISADSIRVIGSTGVDACLRASALPPDDALFSELGVEPLGYLLATIHRAENTTPERLHDLLNALVELGKSWPILFPVHPRTAAVLDRIGYPDGIRYLDPASYPRMMQMVRQCRALLTDSGGLQEEAAVLGTPTFILRPETEWSEFVDAGHHLLVGTDPNVIVDRVRSTLVDGAQERRMRTPIGRDRSGAADRVMRALIDETTLSLGATRQWTQPAPQSNHQPVSIAVNSASGDISVTPRLVQEA
jgi:UDP-N-acetylglucosamine 2-epimerase (non-hydrolysing)